MNAFRPLHLVPGFVLLLAIVSTVGCEQLQPVRDTIDPMVEKVEPVSEKVEPVQEKVKPILDQVPDTTDTRTTQPRIPVTREEMAAAIKQALAQGVDDSIYLLGSLQGFYLSKQYRIPIPEQLSTPARQLRNIGQQDRVDDFEERLNRAAQQAVKQAGDIFDRAIAQMTIGDALQILQGADNAATVYFRQRTEASLQRRFASIISRATDKTGLIRSFKDFNAAIKQLDTADEYLLDIDQYVLDHALDALFDRIAVEERLIRADPLKRTTALMKKVFGYFAS